MVLISFGFHVQSQSNNNPLVWILSQEENYMNTHTPSNVFVYNIRTNKSSASRNWNCAGFEQSMTRYSSCGIFVFPIQKDLRILVAPTLHWTVNKGKSKVMASWRNSHLQHCVIGDLLLWMNQSSAFQCSSSTVIEDLIKRRRWEEEQ